MNKRELARRWRLVLGNPLQSETNENAAGWRGTEVPNLDAQDMQRDLLLEYLFSNEYLQRGRYASDQRVKPGSLEPSVLTPVTWLSNVRKVFPKSTVETLQRQAVERYKLTSLLTDKEVLKNSEPSIELVQTLLAFRSQLADEVMAEVRRIIWTVCNELERVLSQKIISKFSSRRLRHSHGGRQQLSNLDWSHSIRRNLKNYNVDNDLLVLERLYFYKRQDQRIPWDLYIVVDQSGSMVGAIIYAAVIASIFCRVRSLKTRLILFDTEVVDLGDRLDDPVDTLLSVQLGGGTDIGGAIGYVQGKISQPQRSLVVLISDFCEGGDENILYEHVQTLRESSVKMLGLAAMEENSNAYYDERIARNLVDLGMQIGAMTPDNLAQWVADHIG